MLVWQHVRRGMAAKPMRAAGRGLVTSGQPHPGWPPASRPCGEDRGRARAGARPRLQWHRMGRPARATCVCRRSLGVSYRALRLRAASPTKISRVTRLTKAHASSESLCQSILDAFFAAQVRGGEIREAEGKVQARPCPGSQDGGRGGGGTGRIQQVRSRSKKDYSFRLMVLIYVMQLPSRFPMLAQHVKGFPERQTRSKMQEHLGNPENENHSGKSRSLPSIEHPGQKTNRIINKIRGGVKKKLEHANKP